ncbi:MAG: hypothetical protein M1820_005266 [Bogoriella megaspora]|nr:MAG: hypothetical protein M1820_005266 [Bogoriella megaspora]
MPMPLSGPIGWLLTVFKTSNSEFIQKCGLDAYMFLRFLRMLLKIFIPMAVIILPILLPINHTGGGTQKGLDTFSMGNVSVGKQGRLWAHLILAVLVVIWVCYVFQYELRTYIRMRQAYLTSPEHRLRASATTVLVTNIPRKWLTFEALDGLYDVFPGGIRNIWINRNYDELQEKVDQRNKIARTLESAETDLIKIAISENKKQIAKAEKQSRKSKAERKRDFEEANHEAEEIARGDGATEGAHEMANLPSPEKSKHILPVPKVGEGIEAGIGALGTGVVRLPQTLVSGIGTVSKGINNRLDAVNTAGLTYESPELSGGTFQGEDDDTVPLSGKHAALRSEHDGSTSREIHGDTSAGAQDLEDAVTGRRKAGQRGDFEGVAYGQSPRDARPAHALPTAEATSTQAQPHKLKKILPWKPDMSINPPSPQPHERISDEDPFDSARPVTGATNEAEKKALSKSKIVNIFKSDGPSKDTVYPEAFDPDFDEEQLGEPVWKRYIQEKDRPTMRLPIFSWMFSIPFVGKKVDTIFYCRKELARLNAEIEKDQSEPEKYPLMNSAFIQFNHQAAAHMACQAVSHHIPKSMAPRMVEISPQDVLWNNLSVKWWEQYTRIFLVFAAFVGFMVLYLIPITFVSGLSRIDNLKSYSWLAWVTKLPSKVVAGITGVVPQLLLGLFLVLAPLVIRLLANLQGLATGVSVELTIQVYYFGFLFLMVFLVVTLSGGIFGVVDTLSHNPIGVTNVLAQDLPSASDFFLSYLILQALSISAGQLLQGLHLFLWFIWAPISDSTARQKFTRQVKLPFNRGGTLFPVYTNFACIGLIYSVISPLILIFNLITFSLFWIAHRYNAMFVYQFHNDTGGLLFPTAINQLFTGLYVMDLCLIGLFFLQKDADGDLACIPQGAIMIAVTILTAIYQILLNQAFAPMFQYMPITLEDDAVRRDEEFARAHDANARLMDDRANDAADTGSEKHDIESILRERERAEAEQDRVAEKADADEFRKHHSILHTGTGESGISKLTVPAIQHQHHHASWADRDRSRSPSRTRGRSPRPRSPPRERSAVRAAVPASAPRNTSRSTKTSQSTLPHRVIAPTTPGLATHTRAQYDGKAVDIESQNPVGDMLYSGYHDVLEDLTPDERDALVREAFQHQALRARRPIIWLPRDTLGVSEWEIKVTRRFSKYLGVSNDGTAVDAKGRVVFRKSPPDFAERDLIDL